MGSGRSPKRRVRDDDFIVGYRRISSDYGRIVFLLAEALQGVFSEILSFKFSWQAQYGEVAGWLYWLHALEMRFHMWRRSLMTFIFRGRRSICWGCRVTLLAPRIGNDVSYVTQITDDIDFVWQAQYLVRLQGDFTCSAHWKWRFICDADHWWHWFCVAGAVFGEVGGWLFVAGAAHRDILGDSGNAKCCILQHKIVSKIGPGRSPKRRVRDDDFIVGYRRIMLGLWSNRLFIGGSTSGSFCWNLELQDFVAGAVFGEVGGWLYLLHALEMTFHMWCGSRMRFILRGRRSICWLWRVTLLALRIGNDVSVPPQITDDIDFVWQAQYLVRLQGDFTCSAHCKWRFKEVPEQYVVVQSSTGVVLCSTE